MSLVSIIIPAYNTEKYIADAIDSVLTQSYNDWEVLIIDDGSTDGTWEIISKFDDSRIQTFRQENKGVSSARNIGIRNMRGEFFCFLDSDDLLTPLSIELRISKFLEEPDLEFIDGAVSIVSRDSREELQSWRPAFSGSPLHDLVSLSGKCFFGPTWMFRRIEGRLYRFDPQLSHGEDLLFYIDQAVNEGKYGSVSETVYKYRMHGNSAMKDLDGLNKGYTHIASHLHRIGIEDRIVNSFRKKSRSIMAKSYLANGKFMKALNKVFDY